MADIWKGGWLWTEKKMVVSTAFVMGGGGCGGANMKICKVVNATAAI